MSHASRLRGAFAEVGVYRGASAELVCTANTDSAINLFDTFSGVPDCRATANERHRKGDFADTGLLLVQRRLARFPNVVFHEGALSESLQVLAEETTPYAFVHLDSDLYHPTHEALAHFFPRLMPGGVLLAHDWNSVSCAGVRQAFDEYFSDKHVVVIPLWDTQCLVMG